MKRKFLSRFWKDWGERVAWTFGQAFVASLLLVEDFSIDDWKVYAVAGTAAGIAAVKGLVAKQIGMKDSASTVRSV